MKFHNTIPLGGPFYSMEYYADSLYKVETLRPLEPDLADTSEGKWSFGERFKFSDSSTFL